MRGADGEGCDVGRVDGGARGGEHVLDGGVDARAGVGSCGGFVVSKYAFIGVGRLGRVDYYAVTVVLLAESFRWCVYK